MADELRIGVFVCDCGSNIAGYIDVKEVAEYSKTLPNVVYVKENLYTCSESGINEIKAAIKEQRLNRVVVASCTPRTHEPLFRGTCAEADLNPYLFEMVNIRDQCSWVHMQEKEEGTGKAKDLIRMGVAKAALLQPQQAIQSEVDPRAIVLGGGIGGMTAAMALANRGFEVALLEKTAELGGMLLQLDKLAPSNVEGPELARQQAEMVRSNPLITVYTSTTLDEVQGYIGHFKALISTAGVQKELPAGVIIVATGAQVLKPVGLYGYDGAAGHQSARTGSAFPVGEFSGQARRHDPVRRGSNRGAQVLFAHLLHGGHQEQYRNQGTEPRDHACTSFTGISRPTESRMRPCSGGPRNWGCASSSTT